MAKRNASGDREPRRWTLVLAAFVVGLIVVGGVFVELASPSGGDTSSQATGTAAPVDSPTPAVTPSGGSTTGLGCGVTDTRQKLPTSTPKDITWTIWRGIALPQSTSAGPLEIDNSTGVTGCYADTPIGAVLATANIGYRMTVAAPDTTIVDQQVADGPYKKQLRDELSGSRPPDHIPQLAGFRIISYTKRYATVDLAIGNEDGYATGESQMVWQDGTWKMVATADDVNSNGWHQVDDINGYIALKGVS